VCYWPADDSLCWTFLLPSLFASVYLFSVDVTLLPNRNAPINREMVYLNEQLNTDRLALKSNSCQGKVSPFTKVKFVLYLRLYVWDLLRVIYLFSPHNDLCQNMPSSPIPFTTDVDLYHTDFETCFLWIWIWCHYVPHGPKQQMELRQ
jgi:hypothetical protein